MWRFILIGIVLLIGIGYFLWYSDNDEEKKEKSLYGLCSLFLLIFIWFSLPFDLDVHTTIKQSGGFEYKERPMNCIPNREKRIIYDVPMY